MEFLYIAICISIPIAIYAWRESRHHNPASRWPQLAASAELEYAADPPRLTGKWKGRQVAVAAYDAYAVLSTPLACKTSIRVELGPKAEIEREAGLVVPDRVVFNDSAFESRYLLRSQPLQVGEVALDPSMRQRLLQLPDLRVLASSNKLDMRLPLFSEGSELRSYLDVAASLADSIDGS